ncbi:MAG TPA: phosphatase PAP2 family protein [Sphingomonas sp.]|nr:phosphatase PAP2 family protein [Sphingomonas sp.]
MKNWIATSFGFALAVACAGGAWGADRFQGYLTAGEFDVTPILEPAPRPGDPRYETDREIFRATRALVGTPRWALATNDAKLDTASLLSDYSCSVGVALTPQNAPNLVRVLERASAATAEQTDHAKAVYQRRRPYTIDEGQICQARSELYDTKAHRVSYDYPSGHTTRGWTYALILASLVPDHAQQILERGRAYGDSRFICGAHNESAVEAGMLSATATMAAIESKPAYQVDLARARAEMAALRSDGAPPLGCTAEANLVRQRVMPRLDSAR